MRKVKLGLTNAFLISGVILQLAAIAVLVYSLMLPGVVSHSRGWLFGFLFWSGVILYVIGRFAGRSRGTPAQG